MAHGRISMTAAPFSLDPCGKCCILGWLRRLSLNLIHSSTHQMLVSNIQCTRRTEVLHPQECDRLREQRQVPEEAAPDQAGLDKQTLPKPRQGNNQQQPGAKGPACQSPNCWAALSKIPALSGPHQ